MAGINYLNDSTVDIAYRYNDQGVRVSKETNTHQYEYIVDGYLVLVEIIDGTSYIYYTYDVDGTLISMNYQGVEYYYMSNFQGDIIGMIDGSGNIVVKYSYDAWGNIVYQWTSVTNLDHINPYRYRGYRYDVETNLYYLNARYYDPSIARFISADDVSHVADDQASSINLYAYSLNNPVMYTDSTGYIIDTIFDVAFILIDIYFLASNEGYKDWKNWVALGVDILFAAIPFVTGGSQIIKLANIADGMNDLSKVTVVGETMSRVRIVSQFVNATDNIYDGFKAYNALADMGRLGKIGAEMFGKSSNAIWLYNKLRNGYKVVDIGIDSMRTIRSASYMLERTIIFTWKTRNAWKMIYHFD